MSHFREVLVNGETTFDSSAVSDSAYILEDIDNSDVSMTYSGPHVSMPLTLEQVQEILDHFKDGEVS